MRLNYETCIVGSKCVLVPYRPCHVERYHEWMKHPYLLEMTGSEPLSLQEEIDMQISWRDDDQKCTFIVLAREKCNFLDSGDLTLEDANFPQRNLEAMVGDVNLFFSEEEDEEEEVEDTISPPKEKPTQQLQAELDIMIAEEDCRGQGLGKEASCLMMLYGTKAKTIRRFFCKIKENNQPSLSLFQKKLGFQQCAYAACFQEFELERRENSSDETREGIQAMLGDAFQWTTFKCPIKIEESKTVD
ncbi:acetyltransferase 9-like protein [Seminavis robusta]|uniref:Acetyltransferase 9-like protein n=1 Tax=Seminavis robusta TaxID=568900 RepID=A0A9N8EN31_9STRA|nr:acetyltransferase 9-like protein [Seminavis robusta]|eukprot:Sro1204_g252170.1 acetyltransferase 9-like protein (245) ;mRNA; f:2335-3201